MNSFDIKHAMEDATGRSALFDASLTPYRSLGATGFGALMGLFGTLCLTLGLMFHILGAWPVFGFLGLAFMLLLAAFLVNYRSARAFERVILNRDLLLVRQVRANGRASEVRFNPYWTRLHVDRDEDAGVTRVSIASQGRSLAVGAFLNPADKESFAAALGEALARARHGGR